MKAILMPPAGARWEAVTVTTKTVDKARGYCAEAIILIDMCRTEEDFKAFATINECLSMKPTSPRVG